MRTLVTATLCVSLALGMAACKKKPEKDQQPGGTMVAGKAGPGTRGVTGGMEAMRPATGAKAISEADAKARVGTILGLLGKKQYAKVTASFSPKVKAALPADKLQVMWEQLLAQVGDYQSFTVDKTKADQGHRGLFVAVTFAKGPLEMVFSFDPAGKVVGFFIKPKKPKFPPWQHPPYAKPDQVREIKVTVGSGKLALPGILTVPKARGGKRYPAVVLVHGSGPQDMDETIGPNKVFKDLAWGLAAQGIAVLRYTKVTKAHPAQSKALLDKGGFTVDDETTNDAIKAIALLRKNPLVQPGRVFYLGHSQGAMMGPRVGKRVPALAGLILMAGPTRNLADVGLAQYRYIASAGGPQAAAVKKLIPAYEEALKRVKDPKLSPKTPAAELPMGIPASFWLNLRGYHPDRVAAGLEMPVMILQGQADYQVTMVDFAAWKKALKGKKNAVLKSYPRLGHTFVDLKKKKALPMDYFKITGHVAKAVIDDIARFVRREK